MIAILILPFLALCVHLERQNMFRLPNEKINGKEQMRTYKHFFNIEDND